MVYGRFMPVERPDPYGGPAALIARARDAAALAAARIRAARLDLRRAEGEHIDDRTRAALGARIAADVEGLARDIRLAAACELGALGAEDAARALLDAGSPHELLRRAGLLADPALAAEWFDATRLALLERALMPAATGPERPGLIVRLVEGPDPEVSTAASALLIAPSLPEPSAAAELPGALRERLVWRIAAALRLGLGAEPRADHALTEAAEAVIARHDDAARPDMLAIALARAIAARPAELPDLLTDAIGDRRLSLFAALAAAASGLDLVDVRAAVVDPDPARLGLLLRAQGLGRTVIARIVVALAQADPDRDLERFADELDALSSVSPEEAAAHFAPLAAHPDYRAALAALGADR